VCLGWPGSALAHYLEYSVEEGRAVYVKLYLGGDKDFSFERYEVYRAGEKIPFQVGRTDRYGRVVFLPDRPGKWRIRAFSQDGHGLDTFITTSSGGALERSGRLPLERSLRVVVGAALIFGLFGLISLFGPWRRAG